MSEAGSKLRVTRALQGALLGLGAPFGWLTVRLFGDASFRGEYEGHLALYTYLLLGTCVVFTIFGATLGHHEDQLAAANRKLAELSVTDSLTGLKNARYFHARLAEAVAEALRARTPLSLLQLDLDHFKQVNDRHGHPVGDLVLQTAARSLAAVARESETCARVGGEEFALILPGATAEQARQVAERVRGAIAAARVVLRDGTEVAVTVSVGIADAPLDMGPAPLYAAADRALYRAKAAGRNRVELAELEPSPATLPNGSSRPSGS